jgi:uncharacterized protein (UPF0548 family)
VPDQRNVATLAGRAFNYSNVGATVGELPAGYDHIRRTRVIGHGDGVFEAASAALLSWELHRRSGLSVSAASAVATAGEDVLLGFAVGWLRLFIPCRVVYIVDEATQRGFAYGTLAGHPESGEERFIVALGADGEVTTEVSAFSRPALWWPRLGSPVSRRVQAAVTDRYLAALA